MLAQVVFVLCAATAFLCALLLLRGYRRTKTPLLLWSGICFGGLCANNVLVFVDLVMVPEVSLVWLRSSVTVVSLMVLIGGLVWHASGER